MNRTPPLVLIVEDSRDISECLELVLVHAGFRVALAANGVLALAFLRGRIPDVILLDMSMPHMGGLEFLEKLPAECPKPPPVIAMSADESFHTAAVVRGARTFLRKPADLDELLAVLNAVLEGQAPDPKVIAAQAERVARTREANAAAQKLLLQQTDLDTADLRARYRALVEWMGGYFGVDLAFISLARGDEIYFERARGSSVPPAESEAIGRGLIACSDVVTSGAPFIASAGRARTSDRRPGREMRFYAGAPLMTTDGRVLGTLCIADRQPKLFHGEDLALLEQLASGLVKRIEAKIQGRRPRGAVYFVPGVFNRHFLGALIEAERLRIAREGGAIELAVLAMKRGENFSECAADAYREIGYKRFAVATSGRGLLSLIVGDADHVRVRERMDRAIGAVARKHVVDHGSVLALRGDEMAMLAASETERITKEGLGRAEAGGPGRIARVSLTHDQGFAAGEPAPA